MPQPSLLSYRATCLESADLGSVLHFSPLQLSRWTSDAWLAAFIWQLWLNTWLQPPDENITSSKQKARSSSSEPAAAFLNRRFFCAVSPGKSPLPSNFPHYMPLCTAPGRHTLTHTHIYTQVYLFQAFQPVSTELHNQRAVLFPQRSRIVCTHMTSCITVINHVEEITISTRQLQRAVARSNWILLIFPLLPLLPPESRLLLRQTNLEGWGNAIRRERRGGNTLVWVLILNQTLMIIKSKLVPLFSFTLLSLLSSSNKDPCGSVDSPSRRCFL